MKADILFSLDANVYCTAKQILPNAYNKQHTALNTTYCTALLKADIKFFTETLQSGNCTLNITLNTAH